MNTAVPTTAHKKLVGILLTIVFALTCLPAALAVDLNVDAGFYFKQSRVPRRGLFHLQVWSHRLAGVQQ